MKLRDILMSPNERRAPTLDGATTWLNSDPPTPADLVATSLRTTYTCMNWLRNAALRAAVSRQERLELPGEFPRVLEEEAVPGPNCAEDVRPGADRFRSNELEFAAESSRFAVHACLDGQLLSHVQPVPVPERDARTKAPATLVR